MQHVAGHEQVVRIAPRIVGPREILEEERQHRVGVLRLDPRILRTVEPQEELRQMGFNAGPVRIRKRIEDGIRPRHQAGQILAIRPDRPEAAHERAAMRFVGEDALDRIAEILPRVPLVGLVREANVLLRRLPLHGVDIGVAVVERTFRHRHDAECQHGLPRQLVGGGRLRHWLDIEDISLVLQPAAPGTERSILLPFPGREIERSTGHLLKADELHLEVGVGRDHPASRAAGPAVFVIEPALHTEPLALLGTGIGQREPLLAQVLRHQAGAGVHKIAAHAHFLEDMDLSDQFILLELAIPGPERLSPPRSGGIGELGGRECCICHAVFFRHALIGEGVT